MTSVVINGGDYLNQNSYYCRSSTQLQSPLINIQSLDQFNNNQTKQKAAAGSQNSIDSHQEISQKQNQQKETDNNEQDIERQIKQLKNMAIQFKQKLYEENNSDFDQSIIEYSQQQKKIFKKKIDQEQLKNKQKGFTFRGLYNASSIEFSQSLEDIAEEVPTQAKNQQTEDDSTQAAPIGQNTTQESELNISREYANFPEELQIEKISSQNMILESQNKRLSIRIDQLNSTIEKQLDEFYNIKNKTDIIMNLVTNSCFVQCHLYQVVQSAQVEIDQPGCNGYITIQGNKIVIYDDIFDMKSRVEKIFSIYELLSIDYQKVTMKLNFSKQISLKIQFKNQESLHMFDSLVYIQRIKKTITERKPFFNHPDLPKVEGVEVKVIKLQQQLNKSVSPLKVHTNYTHDLNTTTSSIFNTRTNHDSNLNDDAFKSITQLSYLNSCRSKKLDYSPKDNQCTNKERTQLNTSQQQALKQFQQRKSLNVEKGKDFFNFLKNNKSCPNEQFEDSSNYNLNNTNNYPSNTYNYLSHSNNQVIKESSILDTTQQSKTQIPTNNISFFNDSNLSKSVISTKQKKQKLIKSIEEQHEEAIMYLKSGVLMIKYSKNGLKPREKKIQLSENKDQLNWFQSNKYEKNPKNIQMKDIIQIQLGRNSPGFEKHKKLDNIQNIESSFFILCSNGRRLELEARDKKIRNTFIQHLQLHLQQNYSKTYQQKALELDYQSTIYETYQD